MKLKTEEEKKENIIVSDNEGEPPNKEEREISNQLKQEDSNEEDS